MGACVSVRLVSALYVSSPVRPACRLLCGLWLLPLDLHLHDDWLTCGGYLRSMRIFLLPSRKFDHLVLISEKSCAIGHYISSVSGCIEMINSEQRACLISWANFGALTKPRCDLCGEATFNAKSILILKIKILFGTYVGDNFNKIQSHKVQLERAPARLANPTISIQESRP
jgi:hypothetical protein